MSEPIASFGKALWGGLKALGGGNIAEFTEVCEKARHVRVEPIVATTRP